MSDLLAPLLAVMENEVDTFWCFVGFMDTVVSRNSYMYLVLMDHGGGGPKKSTADPLPHSYVSMAAKL
jgi:hypothetical protein